MRFLFKKNCQHGQIDALYDQGCNRNRHFLFQLHRTEKGGDGLILVCCKYTDLQNPGCYSALVSESPAFLCYERLDFLMMVRLFHSSSLA